MAESGEKDDRGEREERNAEADRKRGRGKREEEELSFSAPMLLCL